MNGQTKKIFIIFSIILILLITMFFIYILSVNLLLPYLAKNYAEPCGYSHFDGKYYTEIKCNCKGYLYSPQYSGPSASHCFGECSDCKCFLTNYPDKTKKEVLCSDEMFEKLDWAYTK